MDSVSTISKPILTRQRVAFRMPLGGARRHSLCILALCIQRCSRRRSWPAAYFEAACAVERKQPVSQPVSQSVSQSVSHSVSQSVSLAQGYQHSLSLRLSPIVSVHISIQACSLLECSLGCSHDQSCHTSAVLKRLTFTSRECVPFDATWGAQGSC